MVCVMGTREIIVIAVPISLLTLLTLFLLMVASLLFLFVTLLAFTPLAILIAVIASLRLALTRLIGPQ